MEKLKQLLHEVIHLIVTFIKPYGIDDKMFDLPRNIKREGLKVGFINMLMSILALVFAFMLKLTNLAIEKRMVLIGIILFFLYTGQKVVKDSFQIFETSESKKFDLIFQDEIMLRAAEIIVKVSNNVYRYDSVNNFSYIMSNESIMNSLKNYYLNLWSQKIRHKFEALEIFSVFIMLIVAILTNTEIPANFFVPLIVTFAIVSFISSAYISICQKNFCFKSRKYNNIMQSLLNDLIHSPVIVKKDLEMRLNNIMKAIDGSFENIQTFYRNQNTSSLIVTVLETISQYGVIIFYLLNVDFSTINLATIAEISAVLLIAETALGRIGAIARILNQHAERIAVLENEIDDIKLILSEFNKEANKTSDKEVKFIDLNKFEFSYKKDSDNDKPFSLISRNPIHIGEGEIVILYGPSGSGKSSFMKMLTGRIRLQKAPSVQINRFLFFDEELRFGYMSIYDELFCCSENPDLNKMQYILENLHLWSEIKFNCLDVWRWMKEKRFDKSLSNGQKQRLILAKMLYFLDENIDVLVLDECTSGLDANLDDNINAADAEKILEFIIRYSNKDKRRIVFISTHQNIDGLKTNLNNEFAFKSFMFQKVGENFEIKEIL